MAVESDIINSSSPKFTREGKKLLSAPILQEFSDEIKACFPTFVASVITDYHGLVLHLESNEKFDENLLALSTICRDRQLIDLSSYHKIIRPLSKNLRLMVLLNKSRTNYTKYGEFENILNHKNPV